MTEELKINEAAFKGSSNDYDAIREAVKKLSSASQDQFETIKKEKWFNRVFDMITFSQQSKKRLAEQIGTITQAQQILIELLLRLSANNMNISKIITESMIYIRKIQKQNINLLSRINQLENISADMDINKLSDNCKQVLTACLYKINDMDGNTSEAQRIFANSVISYLDVNVKMDNPIAALENIDSESKKIILACCMEYIFLKKGSSDSYKDYREFIDSFDFGNKTIKRIEKQILSLYNLRGYEGFYLKYKYDNFKEINNIFFFEFEDAIKDRNESKSELTTENISSINQIKAEETKKHRNKSIHFNAFINCEGKLEIEHCVIYYNETNVGGKIILSRKAQLYIKDSLVICKGLDKNAFITCEGSNVVIIENTSFVDCSYFIESKNKISLSMNKCKLKNCFEHFVYISSGNHFFCDISDNVIYQESLSTFNNNNKDDYYSSKMIYIDNSGNDIVQFRNNVIIENIKFNKTISGKKKSANRLCYFSCSSAKAVHCLFIGISTAINVPCVKDCKFRNCTEGIKINTPWWKEYSIDNCIFENCTNIISTADNTIITNCQFISCYNSLISPAGCYGGVKVEFCQFINTKNFAEYRLHNNIESGAACIIFRRDKESDANANYLKNCIFDGVKMGYNYLIAAAGVEKLSKTVTYIEDCIFRNCSTKHSSGKIIKEYIQYNTLFKKTHDFHANRISNCRGLDKINKR